MKLKTRHGQRNDRQRFNGASLMALKKFEKRQVILYAAENK